MTLVRSSFSTLGLLLLLASACASSTPGPSGQTTPARSSPRLSSSNGANTLVTAPLPIPTTTSPSVGSGVPLDAPVTDVKAPDTVPFQGLARGAKTPADRALAEGDAAYQRADFVGAQKAYEKAVKLAPKDPAPLVGVVRSRLSAEHAPVDIAAAPGHAGLEQSVKDLEKAVQLDGKFGPARLELGRSLLVLGRMDEALAVLRKAIDLAPADAETHSAFGVALLATGVIESAAREFEVAAGIESSSAVRFKNLGTALLAAGKNVEAARALERAAVLAPSDARIQNDLGTALLTLGQTERALKYLATAVTRDPRRATYRSNLGYAWAQNGDLARAIVIYREALSLDDRLASAWINLGNALAKQRKFVEAHAAYDKALAIDPADPRVTAVIDELRALERTERSEGALPSVPRDKP